MARLHLLTWLSVVVGMLAACTVQAAVTAWKYNPATGHVYGLTSPGTWDNVETQCTALGGHLVTVNDAAENAWLTANYVTPYGSVNRWIGFRDVAEEGKWSWADSTETGVWYHPSHPDHGSVANAYANWQANEPGYVVPNDVPTAENWAHFDGGSQWNDTVGTQSWSGIYESKRTVFTEPAWVYNPNTNRYYGTTAPAYWEHAQAYAASIGAHLVTINDQRENDFVMSNFASQGSPYLWAGLKNEGAVINGPWRWAEGSGAGGSFTKNLSPTGDAYTNWQGVEPNGDGPYTMIYVSGGNAGMWNDVPGNRDYRPVLEKDAEVPTWVLNPNNGQVYTVIANTVHGNSWTNAEAIAQRWGAHLVTINDAAENVWVNNEANLSTGNRPYKYIGLHRNPTGSTHFEWISGTGGYWDGNASGGSGTSYVNWASGEPNNPSSEPAIMIYGQGGNANKWNDVGLARDFPALVEADGIKQWLTSPITGQSYALIHARMTWENARTIGDQLGFKLADVENAAENEWLRSTLAAILPAGSGVWLGLNDRTTEGVWEWDSGMPTGYFNWAPDGRLGGNDLEDYVYLDLADGLWRDRDGVNLFFALYEIPEPSTWLLLTAAILGLVLGRWRRS